MLSTGTPYGLIAMNRVCEPVAMPDRLTCSAVAPGRHVTKYDLVRVAVDLALGRERVAGLPASFADDDRVQHLEVDHRGRRVVDPQDRAVRARAAAWP